MRRILVVWSRPFAILSFISLLAACQRAFTPTAPTATLTPGLLVLYSYEETTTEAFLQPFRERYPQVDLQVAIFADLDEALAHLKQGFRADVINVCTDYIPLMVEQRLLLPIATERLTHWSAIHPLFREIPVLQAGPGQVWMVPVDAGLEGIVYRTDRIQTPPDSWDALFDPAYAGHIAMPNYARNAIAITALSLGYQDPFHLTEHQLQAVKRKLLAQKPLLLAYFTTPEERQAMLRSGQAWIALGRNSSARELRAQGVPVDFVTPKEGALSWVCGYALFRGVRHTDAAYALLDHYLSPEIQQIEQENFGYIVSNARVWGQRAAAPTAGLAEPASIFSQAHVEVLPAEYEHWRQIWAEVLAAQP